MPGQFTHMRACNGKEVILQMVVQRLHDDYTHVYHCFEELYYFLTCHLDGREWQGWQEYLTVGTHYEQ